MAAKRKRKTKHDKKGLLHMIQAYRQAGKVFPLASAAKSRLAAWEREAREKGYI